MNILSPGEHNDCKCDNECQISCLKTYVRLNPTETPSNMCLLRKKTKEHGKVSPIL